jgi:hypothetical protein
MADFTKRELHCPVRYLTLLLGEERLGPDGFEGAPHRSREGPAAIGEARLLDDLAWYSLGVSHRPSS